MADIKRFLILDANGNVVEQQDSMSIEVDAATTGRGVVNKDQMDTEILARAAVLEADYIQRIAFESGRVTSLDGLLQQVIVDVGVADAAINARIDALDTGNTASLQAEITRATAAEAALQAAIDAEAAARALADGQLGDAITAEQNARAAGDVALGLRIDGVITDLAAETLARQNADTAEATERAAQDALLSGRIDDEVTRANAAEVALGARIDAEETARIAADVLLQGEIDAEESLRASEITRVEGLITAEAQARTAADNALQSALAQETLDRVADVDTEENRAKAAELVLTNALAQEVLDRAAGDLAEKNRAEAAEATLMVALADEVTRATVEEQRIEGKFDVAIAAEASTRSTAVATLTADLAAEAARAFAAEGALRADLTSEVNRATAAEGVLTAALNAEIARATAEEAAVEQRAKAHADALVQGLKPKGSVDYAFTRFIPGHFDGASYSQTPKFRVLNIMPGMNVGDRLPVQDVNGTAPMIAKEHSLGGSYFTVFKYTYTDGAPTGFEYAAEDYTAPNSPYPMMEIFARTGEGDAVLAARVAHENDGWLMLPLALELVDLTEGNNLSNFVGSFASDFVKPNDAELAKLRVALVQNGIGGYNTTGGALTNEARNSGVAYNENNRAPSLVYVSTAAIAALPTVEERTAASNDAVSAAAARQGLGIYELTRQGTEEAGYSYTQARALDFAVGMEVSGAHFFVENSVKGPSFDIRFDQHNIGIVWDWWYQTEPSNRLTQANVALVVQPYHPDMNSSNVVVGTTPMEFVLFNRTSAYNFGDGFQRPWSNEPTYYTVKGNSAASVEVSSSGVSVTLNDNANIEHKRFDPSSSTNFSAGIGLKGPLVGGKGSILDSGAVDAQYSGHSHAATFMHVENWPVNYDQNNNNVPVGPAVGVGSIVRAANVNFYVNGTAQSRLSIEMCSWDAPGYAGIGNWYEQPVSSFWDADPNFVPKGRIATTGTITTYADLSAFALNDVLYVNANGSGFAKYSDIPSGKWAIPVGIKVGDSAIRLIDRPASLKA